MSYLVCVILSFVLCVILYTVDREIFTVKIFFASLVVGENLTHENKTHHVLF